MTNQVPDPDQNPLLKVPYFDPKTGEGLDKFMEWLFDPEVDEAFEQAFPLDDEQNEI